MEDKDKDKENEKEKEMGKSSNHLYTTKKGRPKKGVSVFSSHMIADVR